MIQNKAICLILILIMCLCLFGCKKTAAVTITAADIYIQQEKQSFANEQQVDSPGDLYVHNGSLYFYTRTNHDSERKTPYRLCISAFRNGTAEVILDLSKNDEWLMLMYRGYAYLMEEANDKYKFNIYAFNLETEEKTFLMQTDLAYDDSDYYIARNGDLYLQAEGKSVFCRVEGATCDEAIELREEYVLQDRTYYTDSYHKLTVADALGQETVISLDGGEKEIMYCADGLLVHAVDTNHPLYFIEPDGDIVELFTIDAVVTQSAVNFYGNYVFVSVLRLGELGPMKWANMPYENDTLSGTYRIDLRDYSCVKINDNCYRGLYIFEGSSIYALDEYCNIYQLDFDGNVVDILLKAE